MNHNGAPEDSKFRLVGGSVYLKIPPGRLNHLEIEHIKDDDEPDKIPAKIMAQVNDEGEHYISTWNPNASSQQR